MKFIANENFPLASVKQLRLAGWSVHSITETSPGITDQQVLKQAKETSAIVLTFDRDYGELIFKKRLPVPDGIVYFRFFPINPQEPAEIMKKVLQEKLIDLKNMFTIIERNKIRQRTLVGEN